MSNYTEKSMTMMRKIERKMLKVYKKILKASVKHRYEKAEDLNWKLLQLELRLKQLDEEDETP